MVKYLSVTFNEISNEHRLNPKFFYFMEERKQIISNSKFSFTQLGNKEYFPVLSDGIHAAVDLQHEGDIRYLYVHSLRDGIIDTIDTIFLSPSDYNRYRNKELKNNDVLLSVVGTLGNTAIFSDYIGYKCSLPRNIAYIRTNPEKILPEFLTCFFLSKFSKRQCIYSGGGNIQGLLSLTKLKKFVIPVFDMELQLKFSEKYRKVLNLQKQLLDKINESKLIFYKSLSIDFSKIKKEKFYSVNRFDFSKFDLWTPAYSYPLYKNTEKAIKEKWQTIRLGEIASFKKGDEVGSDNYNKYLDKKDSDVPFIRTSDLINYEIDPFPDFYIPNEIYQELRQDIKLGDILFTKDGKIGMTAMITKNDKAIICSGISRLRLKAEAKKYNLTSEYLFLILSLKETGFYPSVRRTVIASTLPHLRQERLKEFEIPILDKNSIDEITKLLKAAFELKDEKKKLIEEIREKIDSYFEI